MSPKILLIDDDASVRKVLRALLEKEGYTVREAPNGKLAIQEFRRESADLLITDIFMPEQEGIATITAARRHRPDVKIIAMSGAGDDTYLKLAQLVGAQAALHKPLLPSVLLETIRTMLAA